VSSQLIVEMLHTVGLSLRSRIALNNKHTYHDQLNIQDMTFINTEEYSGKQSMTTVCPEWHFTIISY